MIVPSRTKEQQTAVLTYMATKMGCTPFDIVGNMPFEAWGIVRGDKLLGACVFSNKRPTSISLAWAGEPGWLTAATVRAIWAYPFLQLGLLTVTSVIHPANTRSIDVVERMGCKRVGVIPHIFGHGTPGYLYCMDRDDCRWIKPKGESNVEQRAVAA